MTVSADLSSYPITIKNERVIFAYYSAKGTYDIISKNGSLNNLYPCINISGFSTADVGSKKPNDTRMGKQSGKSMRNLYAFLPQQSDYQTSDEVNASVEDFRDMIGAGKLLKLRLKFINPHMSGAITADFTVKLYNDGEKSVDTLSVYLDIASWDNFQGDPLVHSIAPLFGDDSSEWMVEEGYQPDPKSITFYRNGYQSWSVNNLLYYGDKARQVPLTIGKINLENQDETIKSRYLSEMVTVITDRNTEKSVLIGFATHAHQFNRILMERFGHNSRFQFIIALSQLDNIALSILREEQSKSEELLINISKPSEGVQKLTEWARWTGIKMNSRILDVSGGDVRVKDDEDVLSGWCSWYYYYTEINEEEMVKNIEFLDEHSEFPLDIVQLDDGFQAYVGDFTTINEKFPHGLDWLVDKIHDAGYIAGLWIAPFFAQSKSQLVEDHPDWLLRDENGKIIKATFNWGTFLYALDLTIPAVIEHVKDLVSTIVDEWGFDFIKIDFIYAPEAINGVYHDHSATRAEVLRRGVKAIRDSMGDAILLGCGAPLGPCIGLVDVMRIGCDTAAVWTGLGKIGSLMHRYLDVDIPALKPALLATVNRSFMHNRLWFNDPDCVVVREEDSKLSLNEVLLQLTVFGLSGGQVFFSDDLTKLPEDRLYYMNLIIPPYEKGALALDLLTNNPPRLFGMDVTPPIGQRILLAVINWLKKSAEDSFVIKDLLTSLDIDGLESSKFLIYDFWRLEEYKILGVFNVNDRVHLYSIPGHMCRYLSIIPIPENPPKEPIFLSSNLHITQGCKEVKKFEYDAGLKKLTVEFEIGGIRSGEITILVPRDLEIESSLPDNTEILDTDYGQYIIVPVNLPNDNLIEIKFD